MDQIPASIAINTTATFLDGDENAQLAGMMMQKQRREHRSKSTDGQLYDCFYRGAAAVTDKTRFRGGSTGEQKAFQKIMFEGKHSVYSTCRSNPERQFTRLTNEMYVGLVGSEAAPVIKSSGS